MRTLIVLVSLILVCVSAPALAASGPEIPMGDSPSFGPANAPVTIIEFIDFQ